MRELGMTDNIAYIDCATESDLKGIMALQAENQPKRGGTLSASFPQNLFTMIMRETPVIVARLGGHIIGYLVTSKKRGMPKFLSLMQC
jgi:hypothetical protein